MPAIQCQRDVTLCPKGLDAPALEASVKVISLYRIQGSFCPQNIAEISVDHTGTDTDSLGEPRSFHKLFKNDIKKNNQAIQIPRKNNDSIWGAGKEP